MVLDTLAATPELFPAIGFQIITEPRSPDRFTMWELDNAI
jgi:hypothetical protein